MSRDVTLRATWHELVGDETYEIWLKRASAAWALEDTGAVIADAFDQQEFVLLSLDEGVQYAGQIRLKRAGRYRAGYLSADPDTWPAQSRVDFTPGSLEGVSPPTIASAVWARTSGTTTTITLSITLADATKSTKVYRNGVLVATLDPGDTGYVDNNPELATTHVYRARHSDLSLDGPFSDPLECFAGPLPPTDFVQSPPLDDFGRYTITWNSGGNPVRLEDDFACADTFVLVFDNPTQPYERDTEDHHSPAGTPRHVVFQARIRAEVTSFSVTDVTDWATIDVECDIEDTNTEYNSCP